MDTVESLCAVVGEEARVCASLVALLRQEQEAVVALRPGSILACLEERELLHEALAAVAARRRALVQEVACVRGSEAASVSALLPLLGSEPQARLRTELRRLRRVLLEARGLERQNARLVVSGLETTNDLLRALSALVPGARYGADAKLAPPAGGDGLHRHV